MGILASVAASAFGAWWWTTQHRSRRSARGVATRDHGTVIFDNTPTAADTEAVI
jgi:hypothetical protein